MSVRYPYKSEDMMLTRVRSRDNGAMRVAIAYHKRVSIGQLVERDQESRNRWLFQPTQVWMDWTAEYLGLPGLIPHAWHDDPQWATYEQVSDPRKHTEFLKEYGPKRWILILDTEEQAMHFKMRWQDEP